MQDEDGDSPPQSVKWNRHEAWAWDEEKKIRLGDSQKAKPLYTPTFLEGIYDFISRRLYFQKDPMEVVEERVIAKRRLKEKMQKIKWYSDMLQMQNEEKHSQFI
jgi:hypothetical protein